MKPRQPEQRPAERSPMAPGDEAAPGTPGTGEDICPECRGSTFTLYLPLGEELSTAAA